MEVQAAQGILIAEASDYRNNLHKRISNSIIISDKM